MSNQIWLNALPAYLRSRLGGRPALRAALDNVTWLLADKLLRMTLGLFVGAWVARYLGPVQFGVFNYASAFVMPFSVLATLGLNGVIVRNIVQRPPDTFDLLGTGFTLKLVGAFLALVCATFVASLGDSPEDRLTMYMVAVISVGNLFQSLDVIDYWFQSRVQSKYVVVARFAPFAVCSLLKVLLIVDHRSVVWFAGVASIEVALGSLGLIVVYSRRGELLIRWKVRFELARELLRDSWPLMFSGLIGIIYLRIDQIMLAKIAGSEELGLYSAAVRLAEIWYMVPVVLTSTLFPRIMQTKLGSESEFYAQLQKLYNLMALMGYAIAIPTTLLSSWIVCKLFGRTYADAAPMLSVLVWAGIFVNLGVARSAFLTAMNWPGVHLFCNGIGCLINIALNFVLIPRYGGVGAALASAVSYWFAAHGSCLLVRQTRRTGAMLSRALILPKVFSVARRTPYVGPQE